MTKEWLSLSQIAKELGVHPSTVRSWANQGQLPVHRTKGGHRRFLLSEVMLWNQSQQADSPYEAGLLVQSALKQTRFQISMGHLEAETWYQKLDQEAREKYRLSGRALLHSLTAYLATDGDDAEAEARAMGYEYASRGRRYGLSSKEATRAFLFFRNSLQEGMISVYEAAAVHSPHVWSDMFRRINAFTDQILLSLLETYEAFARSSTKS